MTDLRERSPAQAPMQKLLSYRGTDEIRELPFGLVRIMPEALNWLRGTRGELFMAAQLARLGPAWTVLHSVPIGNGKSDIDHIVIGPPGVFPINTKRLIDKDVVARGEGLRSSGWRTNYLPKSAHESDRVIAILDRAGISAPVLPIIAISGASSVKAKAPQWNGRTIGVAPVKKVVGRLKRRSARLTPEQVADAAGALSDSLVWTRNPVETVDYAAMLGDFRRIDRGVGMLNALVLGSAGALVIAAAWWVGSSAVPLLSLLLP